MAFVVPILAAIGGGSAIAGGVMVAGTALSAYGAISQAQATKKLAAASKPADPIAPPVPQAAKAADRLSMMTGNRTAAAMGGSYAGNSSTFLTGPGGVSTGFSLGRNTLLGE